jgi:hypothetical protein
MKYLLAAGAGVLLYMWWKQGTVVPNPVPQNPFTVKIPGGGSLMWQPTPAPLTSPGVNVDPNSYWSTHIN